MTNTTDKMICPRCGVEMNHHCDKLVPGAVPRETQDASGQEPQWGEIITEFHTCPNCGSAACRNA